MTHAIAEDAGQVCQQIGLIGGAKKRHGFLIDRHNDHLAHAGHHKLGVGIQIGGEIRHTLRAQGVKLLANAAEILFPEGDGGVFKQGQVMLLAAG